MLHRSHPDGPVHVIERRANHLDGGGSANLGQTVDGRGPCEIGRIRGPLSIRDGERLDRLACREISQ